MSNNIELKNHIICGQLEIEELLRQGIITEWQPKNSRHQLFHKIKYPNSRFYQGGWGPELMQSPIDAEVTVGRPGYVWCSFNRANEICRWILDQLYLDSHFNQVNTGTN